MEKHLLRRLTGLAASESKTSGLNSSDCPGACTLLPPFRVKSAYLSLSVGGSQ
jgi:hypothetical protein